jgi:hypothetical protein
MVGSSITAVYWIPRITSVPSGNASYFIALSSGDTYELLESGIRKSDLPVHATSMENVFGPILRGPGIAGVYMQPDGHELAIVLLSGHYLHLFGTFDGDNVGNNFTLHSPPHEEDWIEEIQRDWRRVV